MTIRTLVPALIIAAACSAAALAPPNCDPNDAACVNSCNPFHTCAPK